MEQTSQGLFHCYGLNNRVHWPLLLRLDRIVRGVVIYVKIEFICFKQNCTICKFNYKPLKLVDQLLYLGRNISFTESHVNIHGKRWGTAIDGSLLLGKSDFSVKIKREFIQFVFVSILQGSYTTWNLRKILPENLNRNYKNDVCSFEDIL